MKVTIPQPPAEWELVLRRASINSIGPNWVFLDPSPDHLVDAIRSLPEGVREQIVAMLVGDL